jgi:hypothetical protein
MPVNPQRLLHDVKRIGSDHRNFINDDEVNMAADAFSRFVGSISSRFRLEWVFWPLTL